jgi:hypothetical protein
MSPSARVSQPHPPAHTNGCGAAAILAAAIGSFALAVLAVAADKLPDAKAVLTFYKPTGALSGVTTTAILIWLLIWGVLDARWRWKTVALGRLNLAAFILLLMGFLLTFPPIADLF